MLWLGYRTYLMHQEHDINVEVDSGRVVASQVVAALQHLQQKNATGGAGEAGGAGQQQRGRLVPSRSPSEGNKIDADQQRAHNLLEQQMQKHSEEFFLLDRRVSVDVNSTELGDVSPEQIRQINETLLRGGNSAGVTEGESRTSEKSRSNSTLLEKMQDQHNFEDGKPSTATQFAAAVLRMNNGKKTGNCDGVRCFSNGKESASSAATDTEVLASSGQDHQEPHSDERTAKQSPPAASAQPPAGISSTKSRFTNVVIAVSDMLRCFSGEEDDDQYVESLLLNGSPHRLREMELILLVYTQQLDADPSAVLKQHRETAQMCYDHLRSVRTGGFFPALFQGGRNADPPPVLPSFEELKARSGSAVVYDEGSSVDMLLWRDGMRQKKAKLEVEEEKKKADEAAGTDRDSSKEKKDVEMSGGGVEGSAVEATTTRAPSSTAPTGEQVADDDDPFFSESSVLYMQQLRALKPLLTELASRQLATLGFPWLIAAREDSPSWRSGLFEAASSGEAPLADSQVDPFPARSKLFQKVLKMESRRSYHDLALGAHDNERVYHSGVETEAMFPGLWVPHLSRGMRLSDYAENEVDLDEQASARKIKMTEKEKEESTAGKKMLQRRLKILEQFLRDYLLEKIFRDESTWLAPPTEEERNAARVADIRTQHDLLSVIQQDSWADAQKRQSPLANQNGGKQGSDQGEKLPVVQNTAVRDLMVEWFQKEQKKHASPADAPAVKLFTVISREVINFFNISPALRDKMFFVDGGFRPSKNLYLVQIPAFLYTSNLEEEEKCTSPSNVSQPKEESSPMGAGEGSISTRPCSRTTTSHDQSEKASTCSSSKKGKKLLNKKAEKVKQINCSLEGDKQGTKPLLEGTYPLDLGYMAITVDDGRSSQALIDSPAALFMVNGGGMPNFLHCATNGGIVVDISQTDFFVPTAASVGGGRDQEESKPGKKKGKNNKAGSSTKAGASAPTSAAATTPTVAAVQSLLAKVDKDVKTHPGPQMMLPRMTIGDMPNTRLYDLDGVLAGYGSMYDTSLKSKSSTTAKTTTTPQQGTRKSKSSSAQQGTSPTAAESVADEHLEDATSDQSKQRRAFVVEFLDPNAPGAYQGELDGDSTVRLPLSSPGGRGGNSNSNSGSVTYFLPPSITGRETFTTTRRVMGRVRRWALKKWMGAGASHVDHFLFKDWGASEVWKNGETAITSFLEELVALQQQLVEKSLMSILRYVAIHNHAQSVIFGGTTTVQQGLLSSAGGIKGGSASKGRGTARANKRQQGQGSGAAAAAGLCTVTELVPHPNSVEQALFGGATSSAFSSGVLTPSSESVASWWTEIMFNPDAAAQTAPTHPSEKNGTQTCNAKEIDYSNATSLGTTTTKNKLQLLQPESVGEFASVRALPPMVSTTGQTNSKKTHVDEAARQKENEELAERINENVKNSERLQNSFDTRPVNRAFVHMRLHLLNKMVASVRELHQQVLQRVILVDAKALAIASVGSEQDYSLDSQAGLEQALQRLSQTSSLGAVPRHLDYKKLPVERPFLNLILRLWQQTEVSTSIVSSTSGGGPRGAAAGGARTQLKQSSNLAALFPSENSHYQLYLPFAKNKSVKTSMKENTTEPRLLTARAPFTHPAVRNVPSLQKNFVFLSQLRAFIARLDVGADLIDRLAHRANGAASRVVDLSSLSRVDQLPAGTTVSAKSSSATSLKLPTVGIGNTAANEVVPDPDPTSAASEMGKQRLAEHFRSTPLAAAQRKALRTLIDIPDDDNFEVSWLTCWTKLDDFMRQHAPPPTAPPPVVGSPNFSQTTSGRQQKTPQQEDLLQEDGGGDTVMGDESNIKGPSGSAGAAGTTTATSAVDAQAAAVFGTSAAAWMEKESFSVKLRRKRDQEVTTFLSEWRLSANTASFLLHSLGQENSAEFLSRHGPAIKEQMSDVAAKLDLDHGAGGQQQQQTTDGVGGASSPAPPPVYHNTLLQTIAPLFYRDYISAEVAVRTFSRKHAPDPKNCTPKTAAENFSSVSRCTQTMLQNLSPEKAAEFGALLSRLRGLGSMMQALWEGLQTVYLMGDKLLRRKSFLTFDVLRLARLGVYWAFESKSGDEKDQELLKAGVLRNVGFTIFPPGTPPYAIEVLDLLTRATGAAAERIRMEKRKNNKVATRTSEGTGTTTCGRAAPAAARPKLDTTSMSGNKNSDDMEIEREPVERKISNDSEGSSRASTVGTAVSSPSCGSSLSSPASTTRKPPIVQRTRVSVKLASGIKVEAFLVKHDLIEGRAELKLFPKKPDVPDRLHADIRDVDAPVPSEVFAEVTATVNGFDDLGDGHKMQTDAKTGKPMIMVDSSAVRIEGSLLQRKPVEIKKDGTAPRWVCTIRVTKSENARKIAIGKLLQLPEERLAIVRMPPGETTIGRIYAASMVSNKVTADAAESRSPVVRKGDQGEADSCSPGRSPTGASADLGTTDVATEEQTEREHEQQQEQTLFPPRPVYTIAGPLLPNVAETMLRTSRGPAGLSQAKGKASAASSGARLQEPEGGQEDESQQHDDPSRTTCTTQIPGLSSTPMSSRDDDAKNAVYRILRPEFAAIRKGATTMNEVPAATPDGMLSLFTILLNMKSMYQQDDQHRNKGRAKASKLSSSASARYATELGEVFHDVSLHALNARNEIMEEVLKTSSSRGSAGGGSLRGLQILKWVVQIAVDLVADTVQEDQFESQLLAIPI
ncbi:unnamed protein product [Amoebophrya sp. A120]|nr:unnamed protein product [Amoebophrya sp. A120]|eukprot:GSA120T00018188001.1